MSMLFLSVKCHNSTASVLDLVLHKFMANVLMNFLTQSVHLLFSSGRQKRGGSTVRQGLQLCARSSGVFFWPPLYHGLAGPVLLLYLIVIALLGNISQRAPLCCVPVVVLLGCCNSPSLSLCQFTVCFNYQPHCPWTLLCTVSFAEIDIHGVFSSIFMTETVSKEISSDVQS